MGTKSKFFRAFVEGQTVSDGRIVTAEMIDQAVETFNVETYTPGINIEHVTGFSPEPPFNRYGDVVAVRAQTDTVTIDGKAEQRRALYAQVDAHDQLVTLAGSGQKPFPSVELTPDYAGSKKVGLVGLAFTDNPASIATQKLQFSQGAAVRGGLIAKGTEGVALEFEAKPTDADGIIATLKAGFASLGARLGKAEPDKPAEQPKPANDNDFAAFATAMGDQLAAAIKPMADAVAATQASVTAVQAEFASMKAQIETTPQQPFSRQPATGGVTGMVTDC